MDMQDVESTNIAQVGYDRNTGEMMVFFKRGGRYIVHGVEPDVFDAFVHAKSPGGFYAKHIRGAYKFKKIEGED